MTIVNIKLSDETVSQMVGELLREKMFFQCMPGNLSFRHGWDDEWQPLGSIRGMWIETPDEIIEIIDEAEKK